jgi:alpha-galactosidase
VDLTTLERTVAFARLSGVGDTACDIRIDRAWNDAPGGARVCRSRITNTGGGPVRLREVVLFSGEHKLPADTSYYGEGFQMLSQTGGTLGAPRPIGGYTDERHYRLPACPELPDALTAYGLALLSPPRAPHTLLAFASCRRFVGLLRFTGNRFEIAVDTEGLELAPGETWELEELFVAEGGAREALLASLATRIAQHHPALAVAEQPTGWCSWYWYGPRISEDDILDNMRAIAEHALPLTYVQIDDGFQAAMGDWLETGEKFPQGMAALCHRIRDAGFEPAMWVAPFIAERESRLAREHPEWLVQSLQGGPLSSADVSFGGWRRGPWYMLDGTHPGAQEYIERIFRTMRDEWGCRYFKLDALTWGALHGGLRPHRSATRIEAYRRGLDAVQRGSGADSFILGCNAPMWGSLGTVHGMRVSGDIKRTWKKVSQVAEECFNRGWQHQRLWLNDPDCVVLVNRPDQEPLSMDEFAFHATAIAATGGLVLDGDSIPHLGDRERAVLTRLAALGGAAATFDDATWRSATLHRPDGERRCLFNWTDSPEEREITFDRPATLVDEWTGEPLGTPAGTRHTVRVAPRSGRLLAVKPIG